MQVLDLTPPSITIKFTKGSTLNPIFFYLGKDNSVIDMAGFSAHLQARLSPTSSEVLLDLSTETGGLSIITADTADAQGNVISQAQGVQLNVSSSDTSALSFNKAVFGLELTAPSGAVTTMVMGVFETSVELVR